MSNAYMDALGPRAATEQATPDQVLNNTGGYVTQIDKWEQLLRFLILGTEGGTYYTDQRKLTFDNIACLDACLAEDPRRAVELIADVSRNRRAQRNTQAVFALAKAASIPEAREAVKAHFTDVCRIGTDVFQFVNYYKAITGNGGMGRAVRTAVGSYYLDNELDTLALHAVKYRQREGMTHRDVLRMAHPSPGDNEDRSAILKWMRSTEPLNQPGGHAIIDAHRIVQRTDKLDQVLEVVTEFGLPWESVPDQWRSNPKLWEALLPSMGPTAVMRQLATFARLGMLKPMSDFEGQVVEAISNARVHPMQCLVAMKMHDLGGRQSGFGANYRSDSGERFTPNQAVLTALDTRMHESFAEVEPTGQRHLIAVDVSASMGWNQAGSTVLSCREAAAAMALVIANSEDRTHIVGFSSNLVELNIRKGQSFDDAVRAMEGINFGSTNPSAPVRWAEREGIDVDAFVTITDNEVNRGFQMGDVLKSYRSARGIPARSVVMAMTPTNFSIAPKGDPWSLDVVGFDTESPAMLANFVRS